MLAPVQRFSSRVDNYTRFRPGYPEEIIPCLRSECGLAKESVVVDVGSGTGKLTVRFLQNGNTVIGVEPNQEMREAGEHLLSGCAGFTSVGGTAESTTLPGHCADFVAAGQAFHWFDPRAARTEFLRILKPRGRVFLIWNDRRDSTPFLAAYEQLLREFSSEYEQVNHRNVSADALRSFYGDQPALKKFDYLQHFDFDGLKGRLLSSSYAPEAGHPRHESMLAGLRRIFDEHQTGGRVAFEYDTLLYSGELM